MLARRNAHVVCLADRYTADPLEIMQQQEGFALNYGSKAPFQCMCFNHVFCFHEAGSSSENFCSSEQLKHALKRTVAYISMEGNGAASNQTQLQSLKLNGGSICRYAFK